MYASLNRLMVNRGAAFFNEAQLWQHVLRIEPCIFNQVIGFSID